MSKHLFSELRIPIELDNPSIMRHEDKCIKCGQCRRVCEDVIAIGKLYDLRYTNDTAVCIHCGQCANVCPVDSITEVPDYHKVQQAISDPEKIVIISTSPSVRVALGEEFGLPPGALVEGQMIAALRALGADYVLDTNFGADMTIMEEAAELCQRLTSGDKPLPQFTSCCPAWVKFVEIVYPELLPHLSSAKSPIGMQGPAIKTYFAQQKQLDPRRIVNVALTPCTAKKYEIARPEMNASAHYHDEEALRDMDIVITTRELAQWLKEASIDFHALPTEASYDSMMGQASGAGVIFGNTGGVMEAAVRTAYHLLTKQDPTADLLTLTPVRGMDGLREATLTIGSHTLRLAVVHGTENARLLIERMKAGEAHYDFVEVMSCRGGCIGGGGQPKTTIPMQDEILKARIAALYQKDERSTIRYSYANPEIIAAYRDFFKAPLSPVAHALLHTSYSSKHELLGDSPLYLTHAD